ncbi:uncharacterized protein LOC126374565 [Pectinophora gossypiella]|uniref:uncharacterized protein LOC126374565 n=1 Tax=Pectinophora gossypiella TaxID=13191 RepID=UPI00214F367F|nr:uncharacterized protein LOC126374565 [Pectinophora gossypiella]XP_049877191.1 uncharacterized protein LOC126374565 [Pectinophora gossypiella]
MVMCSTAGMGDAALRERLPALWRRIEDAHYSYLETEDSPDKIQQRKKLEGYILEYLSLVPHECKFGLSETGKVFQRTINELPDFSAYRAGLGWAALARYAANLLAQPWRKEYRVIRLYCGYYKHEIEANMVGAETLLHAMGYRAAGAGRLALQGPVCPDTAAAVSRDAIIAHVECQIMCSIWEAAWGGGARVTWADVWRQRREGGSYVDGSEIYSNIPVTVQDYNRPESRYHNSMVTPCSHICDETPIEDPITPMVHPYMVPNMLPPHMMYPVPQHMPEVTLPNPVPIMTPYGVPYYYPVQAPYMIPTPVYAPIKHANNVPLNGYPPMPQYRYPTVPTAQLIELDSPSVYENGKHSHREEERHKKRQGESSRRDSTSKSGFSDISLPSIPRSDTQPALSKAREDGMGTYESWDYVFRNLSSKDDEGDRNRFSPSLDRDSRTLDRLDREERRAKYQPTTLDLEDGLRALNLDRTFDEDAYRTAKVNENLMRLKQEQERKARQVKKASEGKRKIESVGHPKADALITPKVAPDKVKLLTKKEIKDRKEVIKQQNGTAPSMTDVRKVKKPAKLVGEVERTKKPVENGHSVAHTSKANTSSTAPYDLKAQLIVSLDETDAKRSPPKVNGDRPVSRTSTHDVTQDKRDRWECATCTYLNKNSLQACEMCGKSRKGPEIQPLTSGGRECPACTLVNKREARVCDACGTSLEHCPTYI